MAVIMIHESKEAPKETIEYALDPTKTEQYAYVSGIGCDPETAAETFVRTKERYGKKDGLQTRHIIQSFKPGEVSPMVAHEIGNLFVKELFDDYEVVIATHTDKPHVHNHIVFNSVSDKTGIKYITHDITKAYEHMVYVSNQICREYGLAEWKKQKDHPEKRNEWRIHKDGMKTRWDLLYRDVDETIRMALDLENFFELMEKRGYQVIRRTGRFPLFRPKGSHKTYGIHKDGRTLTEEDLQKRIELGIEEGDSFQWETPKEEKGSPVTVETEKGLPVLYRSWLAVLKTVGRGEDVPYPFVSYEEIKRFRQYREQQEYLENNGIGTMEQLKEKIKEVEQETGRLKEERSGLLQKRRQLPEAYRTETEEQKKERFEAGEADRYEVTIRLDTVEEQIRALKHERYLCGRIESEASIIKEKLKTPERIMDRERNRDKNK
ncbi:MAG: relaxase/mobilization nuclease domain-containing protein [Clostridia bacterium]|nr:relaxase/mobilization nuclease domain-containing protein [Clostridia bacterium]